MISKGLSIDGSPVEDMSRVLELRGKVVSGAGRGSFFTQLDWVQDQCFSGLGFHPFSGTLNVEVRTEDLHLVEELQKEEGVLLVPPNPEFCSGRALNAEIEGLSCALIIPEERVRIHGKRIIEVMADKKLKEALNLKDGDTVTIKVDVSSQARGPD